MPVYYDPNLSDQEYYSPENNSQNSGDIGSALRTAGTMIGLNIIGVAASRYLMSAAKSTLKSWQSNSQSIIRRSLAQKTFNLNSNIKKYTAPYKQTIQDSSIYKAGLERQKYLNLIKDSSDYSIKRVTSAFKDPKTLLSTTLGVWRRNVLSGIGVSYGVDSLLGITREMGLDKKAIYDIPGQVGNFAKWLGYSSVGGLALGAAGPALKVAGSLGIKTLQKTFGGEFGKKVLNTAAGFTKTNLDKKYQDMLSKEELNYSASVVKKGLKFGSKINEVRKTLNEGIYTFNDTFKDRIEFKSKTQKAFGVVNAAIRNSVNILKTPSNNSTSGIRFSGLTVANEVANYARQSKDWKGPKVSLNGSQLDDFFAETHRRHNKESILQKVFGKVLKPVRLKDVVNNDWIEETLGNLSEKYTRDTSRQFINKILDLKVGKNIYKDWRKPNIRGGMIDLNFIDPSTMMKNSLGLLLNHQIYTPFVKTQMNLAEILGVNKWLSDAPDMFATRNKPEFRFVDKSNPNITSVGDLSREKDSLFVYTKGGKWAVLSGDTVQVVNTNRNLYRATKTGHDKSTELKNITIDKLKEYKKSVSAAEYNRIVDRLENKDKIGNKYFDFFGLTVPKLLKETLSSFQHKVRTGKGYKDEFTKFFHGSLKDAAGVIPLVENIYGHTTQVLSRVARSREAMQVMANHVNNTQLKQDLLAATFDDQSLINKIYQLPLNAEFFNNKNVVRALEDIKAFPKEARNHPVEKRLGIFSEMTSYDIARTSYIDDIFKQSMDKGQPHPLLRIAPELETAGVINSNEKEALLIHAKLSAFKSDGLIKGVTDDINIFKDVMDRVRTRSKADGYGLLNDLVKFVQRNETRRPSIQSSQEKILDTFRPASDIHPFYSSSNNALKSFGEMAQRSIDRTMNLIEEISPFKKFYLSNHGFTGNMKYLGRTVMGVSAAFGAYRILDTVTAANPLFDQTEFDDGITGVLADSVAKARFGLSRVADITGVTKSMKYLHGLAPLSETAVPGATIGSIFGLFTKASPVGVARYALMGALANRIASPILPDMTKSYEELREIYSGREQVPMYKSPMWLLGGTPWEGTKVIGYSPNWYVRSKSRWKETSTMYGSAFRKLIHEPLPLLGFNVGDLTDSYYMERLHYNTRPFALSGGVFDEVPLIGKTLSATIGRIIKPTKTMHQEYLKREFTSANEDGNPYPFAIRPPTISEGLFHMNKGEFTNRTNYGKVSLINNKYWSETAAEDFLYDTQNFMGLKGFLAGSIAERVFDTNRVIPTLETAGRIASFSRSYTDMNLGGGAFLTEAIRRIIDKPEYRQYGLNPIPNMFPNWLPKQFLTGDAYSAIVKGELRIPGNSYKVTHTDLRETMPARSSILGKTLEQQVQYFTGLTPPLELEQYEILQGGTKYHRAIQDSLAAEGLLIQAEAFVHDVKNDITGHVDAIIRDGSGGKGRKALEIKTIQDSSFNELNAPKEEHVSQLSFYLKMLKMRSGTLLYVNRENPSQVKTFEIYYDKNRWERDLEKLKKARYVASTMLDDSRVDSLGYSYSWADRLKILSDVNPNSVEFKEAKKIVQDQIKFGAADQEDIKKYNQAMKMKKNRIRSYNLYSSRFKNKVFDPEGTVNIQSTNEDIKAAAEYSLPSRILGSLYERFTNTNTFLINKFFAVKDPIEHYKMTRLYGKEYKPWDEPIRGWVDPYMRGLASKTDPISGGLSFGMGGLIFGGGPIGAIAGGILGAGYGGIHGLYRTLSNSTYIPESINEKREIVSYFDAAKYERNNMLAWLSTGITRQDFLTQRDATLTAFNTGGKGATVANLFRGTSAFEKPYIEAFLKAKDSDERQEILNIVPKDLAAALRKQWSRSDSQDNTKSYNYNSSRELAKGLPKYKFDQSVLDPNINLDDIKLKTIQEQGFDQFEFGLGWNEQMLRIQESNRDIKSSNIQRLNPKNDSDYPNISPANLRGSISNMLYKMNIKSNVQVYVDTTVDKNYVQVVVRKNRSKVIINALRNREKYKV